MTKVALATKITEMAINRNVQIIPQAYPGMRIGLFGGSFNPPHRGHEMVARECLKRLKLDQIWIMVSPANPANRFDVARRLELVVKQFASLKHAQATGFEEHYRLFYSVDTVFFLRQRHPQTTFILLIGADNLCSFHKWRSWRTIVQNIPIAVYNRPDYNYCLINSPGAIWMANHRLREYDAREVHQAPGWVFIHGHQSGISSTILRGC